MQPRGGVAVTLSSACFGSKKRRGWPGVGSTSVAHTKLIRPRTITTRLELKLERASISNYWQVFLDPITMQIVVVITRPKCANPSILEPTNAHQVSSYGATGGAALPHIRQGGPAPTGSPPRAAWRRGQPRPCLTIHRQVMDTRGDWGDAAPGETL